MSSRPDRRPPTDGPFEDDDFLDLPLAGAGPARPRPEPPAPPPPSPASPPGPAVTPRPGRVYRQPGAGRAAPRPVRGLWLLLLLLLAVPIAAVVGYLSRLGPGVAALSTDLVELGDVRVGSAGEPATVEVTNRGEGRLTLGEAGIEGDAAGDFVVLRDDCAGRALAAGERCAVRLAFAPTAQGPRRARLAVPADGPGGPATAPLLGVGTASALAFEPGLVDFGDQLVGTPSPTRSLAVVNRGSAPLALHRVGFDGLGRGAGDFVMRRDGCSSHVLTPGGRCLLEVEFVPTAAGPRQAALRLGSDAAAAADPPRLVGNGLPRQPRVGLRPAALVFAETAVGEDPTSARLGVRNEGSGPLTVTAATVEGGGAEFAADAAGCLARPVPAGGECAVVVAYRPSGEGDDRAVLVLRHDAGEGADRVPLSGVGTAPGLFVDPQKLSFGATPLHREPPRLALRLVSAGSAPLVVEAVRVAGGDAAAFTVPGVACAGASLAPGAACEVTVAFQPRREGPHRAELEVEHAAEGSPLRVPLNGLGTTARLVAEPRELDFGQVQLGAETSRSVRLANAGRAPVTVSRVRLAGAAAADFRLAEDRCGGVTLGEDARCSVVVAFRPGTRGGRPAVLLVEHDAADEPLGVGIVASGVPAPSPQAVAIPDEVDLGLVPVGQRSPIAIVTVRNPGTARLGLGEARVTGADAEAFRVVPGSCAGVDYVAAGGDCTFGVRFEPLAAGAHRAVLVVRHDAGEPLRVELAGRAPEPAGDGF